MTTAAMRTQRGHAVLNEGWFWSQKAEIMTSIYLLVPPITKPSAVMMTFQSYSVKTEEIFMKCSFWIHNCG